jgi:hypothetical protein
MNKQEMVERLVAHTLQNWSDEPARDGSRQRHLTRCPDFAKMPERLLKRELQFRGLLDFDEPELFDEDDADADVSGDDLRVLISRSPRPSIDNHVFD